MMNAWSYTSIPQYVFMELCLVKQRDNFTLPYHDHAPSHGSLSAKQFPAQKSITGMEHPPYSLDLAPNDFWLFPKIKNISGY
jgi:hypothetical protein